MYLHNEEDRERITVTVTITITSIVVLKIRRNNKTLIVNSSGARHRATYMSKRIRQTISFGISLCAIFRGSIATRSADAVKQLTWVIDNDFLSIIMYRLSTGAILT